MTQGATPEVNSRRRRSAGAAFSASIRYLLLKPISSPGRPRDGALVGGIPDAVLVVMDSIPSPKTQRRGLFSLSLMIRETRSMDWSRVRASPSILMVLFRGMAFL